VQVSFELTSLAQLPAHAPVCGRRCGGVRVSGLGGEICIPIRQLWPPFRPAAASRGGRLGGARAGEKKENKPKTENRNRNKSKTNPQKQQQQQQLAGIKLCPQLSLLRPAFSLSPFPFSLSHSAKLAPRPNRRAVSGAAQARAAPTRPHLQLDARNSGPKTWPRSARRPPPSSPQPAVSPTLPANISPSLHLPQSVPRRRDDGPGTSSPPLPGAGRSVRASRRRVCDKITHHYARLHLAKWLAGAHQPHVPKRDPPEGSSCPALPP